MLFLADHDTLKEKKLTLLLILYKRIQFGNSTLLLLLNLGDRKLGT